jgi:hypothetical protein
MGFGFPTITSIFANRKSLRLATEPLRQSSLKRQHLAIVPRGRRLGNARVEVAGLVAADRLSSLGWLGSGAAVVTMAAVPLTAHITRHREGAKLWIE